MKKRLIGSLIAGIMIFSLVGCGGSEKSNEEGNNVPVASEESSEDKDASKENLDSGQRNVTKEEIVQIADKHYEYMRKLLKEDGLPIGEVDKYKDGVVELDYVGDECAKMPNGKNKISHIDIDYAESNNAGSFALTVDYSIDIKAIKDGEEFDLRKTPFEKYGSILVKNFKLNYDELNKKINEVCRKIDNNFSYENVFYEEKDGNVIQIDVSGGQYDEMVSLQVVSPQYIYK
ncbi:hypothetical protein [Clostridium chrysemydis]|uniref:hypothetical protein n=1 Tax=Clostridium chrysemydis TaxID=2665504 RepID=UPI003F30E22D